MLASEIKPAGPASNRTRNKILFVFYDTETSGLNLDFDQILQFAAIRTDESFNVLDTFNIRCRCLPWIIPAPTALKVTSVTPKMITDPQLPSFYEMMSCIHATLENWSPSVFIGYNSMRFDEPLLQRAFWQTLHPPYLTVTNGNSRLDLLPIMQAASLLANSAVRYPTSAQGKTTFKLDLLAPINGFDHANAHDALADVEATIHLAKLVAQHHNPLWKAAVSRSSKLATSKAADKNDAVLMLEGGNSIAPAWWATRIDQSTKNESYGTFARLDFDWENFATDDATNIGEIVTMSPKPFRLVALNKAPLFLTSREAFEVMGEEPSSIALERVALLKRPSLFRDALLELSSHGNEPWPISTHLEQQIFNGFPDRHDSDLMKQFHTSDVQRRSTIMSKFHENKYKQLAQRIIFSTDPAALKETERSRLNSSIASRILVDHDDKQLWRTIPEALRELHSLQGQDGHSQDLDQIESWVLSIAKTYSKFSS